MSNLNILDLNILDLYRDNFRYQGGSMPRAISRPRAISIPSSRYYNPPPRGGYIVDSEYNYVIQDDDDISSTLFLEIFTNFGKNDTSLKNYRIGQIKSINSKRIKASDIEEVCPICIDNFKIGEYKKTLICNHSFHKKCIDRWFKKQHSDCPMCRTNIIKEI